MFQECGRKDKSKAILEASGARRRWSPDRPSGGCRLGHRWHLGEGFMAVYHCGSSGGGWRWWCRKVAKGWWRRELKKNRLPKTISVIEIDLFLFGIKHKVFSKWTRLSYCWKIIDLMTYEQMLSETLPVAWRPKISDVLVKL